MIHESKTQISRLISLPTHTLNLFLCLVLPGGRLETRNVIMVRGFGENLGLNGNEINLTVGTIVRVHVGGYWTATGYDARVLFVYGVRERDIHTYKYTYIHTQTHTCSQVRVP